MSARKLGRRQFKKKIQTLLEQNGPGLERILRLPLRQAVNPLFSFFYSTDDLLPWRAVVAMGAVVSQLAEEEMESARVVIRRLLWNLNDESGGIGWGSPEALGEIMARSDALAKEYSAILVSYLRPDGNYIEYEMLQRGVLWGVGRLAERNPRLLQDVPPLLTVCLASADAVIRGLAARCAGFLGSPESKAPLTRLVGDATIIRIFQNGRLQKIGVGQLAAEALVRITASGVSEGNRKKGDIDAMDTGSRGRCQQGSFLRTQKGAGTDRKRGR